MERVSQQLREKTEKGACITSTLVQTTQEADYIMPLSSLSRLALEEADNIFEMVDIIYSEGKNSYAFTLMMADDTIFVATQNIPSNVQNDTADIVVYTNTFLKDSWNKYLFDKESNNDKILD